MAYQNSGSPRAFNRPRMISLPPVTANPTLFEKVAEVLGGKAKVLSFIKALVLARYEATGWRTVKDIASRDTKHAAAAPNTPATEMLSEPFNSLTVQLAAIVEDRTSGELKLTRDETLSVIAVLRDDQATLVAEGIKIWDTINDNIGYATMGCSALPPGQISESAKKQALSLQF